MYASQNASGGFLPKAKNNFNNYNSTREKSKKDAKAGLWKTASSLAAMQ